ncbi:MAG TPA: YifB family Mg chelatase-like AAA ATPase [Candidatus Corynebacterium avicola]|uniref:YifB family Mg chelatase-like AAA ATPase n=1 Tax=Candidatus Corynebacterium avicola TaxID=2838527 RepID=A0A9D1RP16_9CORY|nr:YifB family Mg chelatase-like AAA ATPase [Candidatus Corynebacterium avicola]
MRVGQATGVALSGISGIPVLVECDISRGLPGMSIVGLGDTAVVQARDRVRSAMINSGLEWPKSRVVMSLSPASVPKSGSGFDLPMVLAILVAQGRVPAGEVSELVVIGELGLDGTVRPVDGVLPMVLAARERGCRRAAVPVAMVAEAQRVAGVEVVGLAHLRELLPWVREGWVPQQLGEDEAEQKPGQVSTQLAAFGGAPDVSASGAHPSVGDLADVLGQQEARRGLEVAAAGGHHLWLTGPPGSGKSMLAERLPGIMPALDEDEQLETAAVHSVAGQRGHLDEVWQGLRPFVAPHHSVSPAALTGGGSGRVRPGAVSLAHNGVLFIDEAPEVATGTLELLRTPMETGRIEVMRHRGTVVFPARFQLVLASNPCPCGAGDVRDCRCRGGVRDRYLHRLSGPLLDRVDVCVRTTGNQLADLVGTGGGGGIGVGGESTATLAERVSAARERARHRWCRADALADSGARIGVNATVPGTVLRRDFPAEDAAMAVLQEKLRAGAVSQRGVDRTLRVAWTLSDLGQVARPGVAEVMDSLEFFTGAVETGREVS